MLKLACPLLISWFALAPCWTGDVEDGIYVLKQKGDGIQIIRNDGSKAILGKRLSTNFGKATIHSISNDNSNFELDLQGAGPWLEHVEEAHLTLVIGGICFVPGVRSTLLSDGTHKLHCFVFGEKAMQKVAATLNATPKLRKHPGHSIETRWTPERESFAIGDAVMLKMEIRNVGTVPLRFLDGGKNRGPRNNQFRFLAFDTFGRAIPDTGDPANAGGPASLVHLKPGETLAKSINVGDWFKLPEPGAYRITGLYEMNFHEDDSWHRTIWDEFAVGECTVNIVEKGSVVVELPVNRPPHGRPEVHQDQWPLSHFAWTSLLPL